MPKVLIVVPHRINRAPSQRFRFEQYLSFLEQNGYSFEFSYLVSEKDDEFFYQKGHLLKKMWVMVKAFFIRIKDVMRCNEFDFVFIQREAFFIGNVFFEKLISKKVKTIFDFDDAIWLMDVSEGNKLFKWLKRPMKTAKIAKISSLVFAGNQYLSEFAKKYNANVEIIPTTIDTNQFKRLQQKTVEVNLPDKPIVIGWTGSLTTLKHLSLAFPIFKILKNKFGNRIKFKAIADGKIDCNDLQIDFCTWKKETEVQDLCEIDIGIMPLPNDDWSKGKCGFKGLQYMALEIPTVMSPVGVNKEIIQDRVNGFLADGIEEWVEKLSLLIESPELRLTLGSSGRETVIKRYSFEAYKNKYLELFTKIANQKR